MAGNRPTDDESALELGDLGSSSPVESDTGDHEESDHAMLRVRVSLKGRPIRSYTFDKDVVTIGRDPDSDIYLDNPGISRHHVRLEKTASGYVAEDLGSANGSYLNDEPIQKEPLSSDDVVRIGKFSLWISFERDRRGTDSQGKMASPTTQQGTTVLSTTELETMMAKVRAVDTKPAASRSRKSHSHTTVPKTVFATWIIVSLLFGTALGAAAFWFLIR